MKKQAPVFIIAGVLVIVIIIVGVLLRQQTGKLNASESEVAAQSATISSLKANVSSLQTQVASLQKDVTDSKATASSLQSNLNAAETEKKNLQSNIATLQNQNAGLTKDLTTVKYPRHFASADELSSWLQKLDINTKYPNATPLQRAFILETLAAGDGLLLPVVLPQSGGTSTVYNADVISGVTHTVRSTDLVIQRWYDVEIVPPYPIPPPK